LVKATVNGLQSLRTPAEVAQLRGLSVNQVLGLGGEGRHGAAEPETASDAPAPEAPSDAPAVA
jgi:small subunit ribosomal protein S5